MLRERAAHLDTTGLVPLFLNLVPLLEHWSKRGARGGERSGGGGRGFRWCETYNPRFARGAKKERLLRALP